MEAAPASTSPAATVVSGDTLAIAITTAVIMMRQWCCSDAIAAAVLFLRLLLF